MTREEWSLLKPGDKVQRRYTGLPAFTIAKRVDTSGGVAYEVKEGLTIRGYKNFVRVSDVVKKSVTPRESIQSICAWQDETFLNKTIDGVFAHLKTEIAELESALSSGKGIESEAADVFLLIVGLANTAGFDLMQAVDDKMAINRQRTWGPVNEQGFREHVRNDEGDQS